MQSCLARLEHFFTLGRETRGGARPFRLNVAKAEISRAGLRDDDEVDARGQELGRETKRFATEPFHTVSRDGVADGPRRDDAEPRGTAFVARRNEQHEMARAHGSPRFLDAYEIRPPANPAVAAEAHYFL